MADPVAVVQQAAPTWQWLASAGGAIATLLALVGVQYGESRKRGRADQQILALEQRCSGLHESLVEAREEIAALRTAMIERCERLENLAIELREKLRTRQAVCDERHPQGRKQMSDSHDEPGGARKQ